MNITKKKAARRQESTDPVLVIVACIAAYVGIACLAYGLRHPELTDTQRLLNFWEAMTWK